MALFHGIMVYEIIDNGNVLILNGMYSTSADFKISNEIAKREITNNHEKDIVGNYKARYIETLGEPKKAIYCTLEITQKKDQEAYEFKWKIGKDLIHKGIGIKINSNRIAVSYIEAS
ncbi:hypothetical protein G7092_03770 [Mucilaginibacter sp. HC2]|uniref:hypothetical protein n=1 Tax=Mucilaginibacter inviolabilis TaxID=2714892 RepID=UPI00140A8322|nr:hypothetical protein [Mucilaginibacter inviolabilis]NHA02894.1 hypothetical protein [Mucilaginibacter inviolabilis]